MERTLLKGCQWKLHPPTTHEFIHQFVHVLEPKYQSIVQERSMLFLKHGVLWEHVLHQQKQRQMEQMKPSQQERQQQQQHYPDTFLPSTLAYASLLLAMEDLQLPLVDKQACCLALLQVADLSTHTPHLSKAYNWLVFAKNMQEQLLLGQQQQQKCSPAKTSSTAASSVAGVASSPTTTAAIEATTGTPSTKGTHKQQQQDDSHLPPSATEKDATISKKEEEKDTTATSSLMVVEETIVPLLSSDNGDNNDGREDLTEVIFYSHTYMGGGFEVMAVDLEDEEEDDDYDLEDDTENLIGEGDADEEEDGEVVDPGCDELSDDDCLDSEPELVLTESLDEDGFEVSYVDASLDNQAMSKNEESLLAQMIASPREVTL
jgi:hypothetical protein